MIQTPNEAVPHWVLPDTTAAGRSPSHKSRRSDNMSLGNACKIGCDIDFWAHPLCICERIAWREGEFSSVPEFLIQQGVVSTCLFVFLVSSPAVLFPLSTPDKHHERHHVRTIARKLSDTIQTTTPISRNTFEILLRWWYLIHFA